MSTYYFEMTERDRRTGDADGLDFATLADATADAQRALAEMGAERFGRGRGPPSALSMEIFSAEGRLLTRVVMAISVQSFPYEAYDFFAKKSFREIATCGGSEKSDEKAEENGLEDYERIVLRMIRQGKSNSEIALALENYREIRNPGRQG